jgi:SAM-dependent methyltransferase
MSSVTEHYESLLSAIYVWMAGGMDVAMARGRAEVQAVCPLPCASQWAVDLGAGFGMHAIPVADLGYSVLAIDGSSTLLDVIEHQQGMRPIKTVRGDLLSFKEQLAAPAALILCMGDTLTHLPDRQSVERLVADVAAALEPGGTFIATFRDYSRPLVGTERFIPVRSDSDRILTCFLEYQDETVTVHDILHERAGAQWRQRVSAYRKLRLAPEWVVHILEAGGLQVRREPGLAGMVRLIATRPQSSAQSH